MSIVPCVVVDSGSPFYKFEKVHKLSTDRIETFRQTAIRCLLSNEYKFIGVNN